MFLFAFSFALLIANIYCFIKKKYLYLFIPCFLFLPEYYGFELSESLPIITVKRIMVLIFYIYAILNRKKNFSFKSFDLKTFCRKYSFLIAYFILRTLTNLYYIGTYGQAAKTLLSIFFEQLFIILAFCLLDPSAQEVTTLIKSVVWSATALFVIGILESFTSIKPFDYLYTVSRVMLNDEVFRLGLLRSTATFGLPNLFGNACILVLPLILYLYNRTHHKEYLAACIINFFAVIHSGCRSDIVFFFAIIAIYALYVIVKEKRFAEFIKNASIMAVITVSVMVILSLADSRLSYYYSGTAKSLLNEVGFNFDLDSGAPESTSGYGRNTEGSESRTRQFTGIYYVSVRHPIVGMGSGAQTRGQVEYYWDNTWYAVTTYDVGLVEIFCDEGILGLLGVISLLIFMFLDSLKPRNAFYLLCIITYLMSTLSSINMFEYLFLYMLLFSRKLRA